MAVIRFSHSDINQMVKDALDAKSGQRVLPSGRIGQPQTPIERLRAMMGGYSPALKGGASINGKNKMNIPQREM